MQNRQFTVLTIIPAKSNSRRLPGKNVRELCGVPLVVRAIAQAKASGVCGEICVATDSEATAELARQAGATVPFLRSDDVDDITSVGKAAANILRRYRVELGRTFDLVCLLLATSPLRRPEDITGCYALLTESPELDAAVSVVRMDKHPYWAWEFTGERVIRPMFAGKCDLDTHQLNPAYIIDGAVYWARADFFERVGGNQYAGKVGGYVTPSERYVDVDTPRDFAFAEFLLKTMQDGA